MALSQRLEARFEKFFEFFVVGRDKLEGVLENRPKRLRRQGAGRNALQYVAVGHGRGAPLALQLLQ